MSKRRDWDKVARERRIEANGSIPDWVDGWAPSDEGVRFTVNSASNVDLKAKRHQTTGIEKPSGPKRDRKIEENEQLGEWTLLRLDYSDVGGTVPPLVLFQTTGGAEARVNYVEYACINMPETQRVAFVSRHGAGLKSNFGRQLKLIYEDLCRIGKLSMSLRNSTFTFGFEFRN